MSNKCSSVALLIGFICHGSLYGQEKVDFSRFVVVGDSLSAGYQNDQLITSGQMHGYANVVATQITGKPNSLNLPLVPGSFPMGGFPQITIEGGLFSAATGFDITVLPAWHETHDVAVPGFNVSNLISLRAACPPNTSDPIEAPITIMAAAILHPGCFPLTGTSAFGPGQTELEVAVGLKPTTSILWIGSNDVLFSLLFTSRPPTDPFTFGEQYHFAASTMAHASKHLILANIPDVTKTAYLLSIPKLAAIVGPTFPVAVLGLQPGDVVTPYAISVIQAMVLSGKLGALPEAIPQGPATSQFLVPVVIRAAKLQQIRNTVLAYNFVIAIEALIHRATLVDVYSLVNELAANGITVNGKHLTTDVLGGLYSLDGIHPTNTGYAIIANQFIKTMNRSLDLDIPLADVSKVAQTDPLFPASAIVHKNAYVSVEMAQGLQALGNQR